MKKIKKLQLQRLAYWFICRDDKLMLIDETKLPKCTLAQLSIQFDQQSPSYLLGYYQHTPCILVDLQHQHIADEQVLWVDLRSVLLNQPHELSLLAGRAVQVAHFLRTHQFCGQCGQRMTAITWEVAQQCRSCGHRAYPRISPAVIMAVIKDGKVLLAQNKRHRGDIYSVLAGFVEVGESLEQTVAREVKEEVGLEVTNIRYFGSQPWPFPHNMMIAYLADYAGGEIKLDPHELIAGDWFDASNLPDIPGSHTIAREMIDHVLSLEPDIKR
ncbi:NAD(+) diphosphatase [Psychrobium sp. 1_MG-2023]|uniref:NAD(+) diphosphatase n=1 Tax=Psychrobium sp. 1_MG-2023 TaxID=3062624 RepID=UPI000C31C67B|nr:NAD(+) diphosphatase [Psychrobium sp. 1_MG-2023]MDP2560807.1 NAD(+) diphosphatase [Psychrobium sp. 1_MG-2023]PKF56683.1 NAD(+) diphosphatase [Alteromonadales bacterium alter-6D02]